MNLNLKILIKEYYKSKMLILDYLVHICQIKLYEETLTL